MTRRFDCRRVKLHRSYTISELSALVGAHKHTIGRWIAAGLKTTDAKRPLLIRGDDFRSFMKAREPIKQRLDDSASAILNADFDEVRET